jgi:hypothetical protein
MFLILLAYNEHPAARTSEGLREVGFQTTHVPMAALIETLEAIALGGGRIDAVVLPIDVRNDLQQSTHLDLARGIRNISERVSFRGAIQAQLLRRYLS